MAKINLDLSDLEGQDVKFILRVVGQRKSFEDQYGFWLVPQIVNVK